MAWRGRESVRRQSDVRTLVFCGGVAITAILRHAIRASKALAMTRKRDHCAHANARDVRIIEEVGDVGR